MTAASFAEVYDEFQPKVRRYLGRLVGCDEAEDLTQEVFARVHRALPGFRGDAKLSTWLYRIATNVALDTLRRRSSDAGGRLLQIAAPPEQPAARIDDRLARREVTQCVRRYIDELPPDYRGALLLSEEEELSDQEIAEALDVTLATVKIRLHRARARLRTALQSGCTLYRDERNEVGCEPRPRV
jgi:RNA polymerase sigma-70 factor, ECF subfamily